MENIKLKKFILAESFLDRVRSWVSIVDRNLNTVIWNSEAEKISGSPKNDLARNQKVWKLLYPDAGYRKHIKQKLCSMLSGSFNKQYLNTLADPGNVSSMPIEWEIVDTEEGVFLMGTGSDTGQESSLSINEIKSGFKILSSHLPCAVYIKDSKGKFVFFNDYFKSNFGWDTSGLLGKVNEQIWPAETAKKLSKNDRQVLSGKKTLVYEESMEIDGTLLSFMSYKFPIKTSEGPLIGGISLNITDWKTVNDQLKKTMDRDAAILDLLPDIVIETDSEGKITYINSSGGHMLGIDAGCDDTGLMLSDILAAWHKYEIEREIKKIMETGQKLPKLLEFTIVNRIGEAVPVLGHIAAIVGDSGKAEGIRGVLVDIRDLKEKEKALEESKDHYKRLFANSRDGIYISTLKGEYVDANPALVDMLGYGSREELIIRNISTEIYADKSKRPLPHERDKPFEARLKKKDGTILWVEISSKVIYRDGKPAFYEGIVRDISQRKEYESKLRYKSFHDSLTGLYNRAYFEEELNRLDNERQLPLSIIMGDVNSLKLINDAFGHKKGDRLLKECARILSNSCRKDDILARWGGDEFALLLPKTSQATAGCAVKRIKDRAKKCIMENVPISISLGIATKTDISQDIDKLISEAEDNMYKQKLLEKKTTSARVINSLHAALVEKKFFDGGHPERVKKSAAEIGEALQLPVTMLDNLSLLATYHDIGKVVVDEDFANKNQGLEGNALRQLKRHAVAGYNIAMSIPELSSVAEEILSHHERWDGGGYPRGLSGKEIPLLARILAAANTFDNVRTKAGDKEAAASLKKEAGAAFDPQVVSVFMELLKSKK